MTTGEKSPATMPSASDLGLGPASADTALRIMQIGDLHFGATQSQPIIDAKDDAFSKGLSAAITPDPVQDSIRSFLSFSQNNRCDAIVAMGDIVDKGRKENYNAGIQLLLSGVVSTHDLVNRTAVVPGNHDINRQDALRPDGMSAKFDHIREGAKLIGIEPVEAEHARVITLSRGEISAEIYALNSCLGCGESRSVPKSLRAQFQAAIDAEFARNADEMLKTYYEQLDTPAFGDNAINDLGEKISALDTKSVVVVAAHHNILPQAMVRLDPYSELVNAGQVRNFLLELNRPVIYLHGHIHTDPVEIITHPGTGHGVLICISAPEVRKGYNVVEVLFNRQGIAYGCLVRRFRPGGGSKIKEEEPLRVPFHRDRTQAMNRINSAIVSFLFKNNSAIYFSDLVQDIRKIDEAWTEIEIASAAQELSWRNYIHIHNEGTSHLNWRLEKPF